MITLFVEFILSTKQYTKAMDVLGGLCMKVVSVDFYRLLRQVICLIGASNSFFLLNTNTEQLSVLYLFLVRKSKDYVYGIWVYKILSIWKGYHRIKTKTLVSISSDMSAESGSGCVDKWDVNRRHGTAIFAAI